MTQIEAIVKAMGRVEREINECQYFNAPGADAELKEELDSLKFVLRRVQGADQG